MVLGKALAWCGGIVLSACIIVGVVLIAAYSYAIQPSITIEDASLTRFALATSPSTALGYNISLSLAVRNKNWATTMKNTEPLEAAYKFDGQQFDRVQVTDKGDKHTAKKTRVYRLVTSSDGGYVALGNAGVAEYKNQNATGVFELEVMVTGEVRYTWQFKKNKIEATCKLKLQLDSPGTAVLRFEKVKCKLAKQEKK
ncbi:hypothetical protein CFC21_039699 [Triticum aestivum]|uniref:Late embryogenesis abundant protein LEA-2 subgroup domain-containing protein n=2 Tax=Triticum aestivum TaxID=4565 RepID=A0A9R1FFF5_WHEAT|nr:uncharacterized protein LOC123067304 [Triticum aestivum]KAF7027674.1 hypothetical protein CFC21_039698 [Triticum aestivum]KAF7027675.1 hypothetical protein CFC21_039699 [Triticum aestivum]CDM81198.1 unnamed protein product [Triticum aestivum]